MKIARYKRVQRFLLFYRHNFNFTHVGSTNPTSAKRPIVVLADGTFFKAALDNQLNLAEQLRVYFGQEIKILTTSCVVRELESLGNECYGALHIARQHKKISCNHSGKYYEPTTAADCIEAAVGEKNEEQYFVATQDPELTEALKTKVAGCPLLFIKYRTVLLDRPSQLATETVERRTRAKLDVAKADKKELATLKRELITGDEESATPKKKRRRIKGPNPLSCKGKKKTKQNATTKSMEKPMENEGMERREGKKRKRKRKNKPVGDSEVVAA